MVKHRYLVSNAAEEIDRMWQANEKQLTYGIYEDSMAKTVSNGELWYVKDCTEQWKKPNVLDQFELQAGYMYLFCVTYRGKTAPLILDNLAHRSEMLADDARLIAVVPDSESTWMYELFKKYKESCDFSTYAYLEEYANAQEEN